jgi:hypothetical protein
MGQIVHCATTNDAARFRREGMNQGGIGSSAVAPLGELPALSLPDFRDYQVLYCPYIGTGQREGNLDEMVFFLTCSSHNATRRNPKLFAGATAATSASG